MILKHAILYNEAYFDEIIEKYSDSEGRICYLILCKDDEKYCFINVYAPNNHYESQEFFSNLRAIIESVENKFPDINLFVAGDFNVIFDSSVDAVGRFQSKQEQNVINDISSMNIRFNLKDSYRQINKYGGFTWGRNNPTFLRSRLDHIFTQSKMLKQLVSSSVTFIMQESDHGFLFSEFVVDTVDYGPGIVRANSGLFEDPDVKKRVIDLLNEDYNQSKQRGWNPHLILDHHKFVLRQTLLREGRLKKYREKSIYEQSCYEITNLRKELDDELIKSADLTNQNVGKINNLKEAIELAEGPLNDLKNAESKRLIFRSKAKWSEEGEKSTKYFLNLIKDRQKKMVLRKIVSNGISYYKQDEISKAISKYYRELYKKQKDLTKVTEQDDIFKGLPSLNDEERKQLEIPIDINELFLTLNTCSESAPGPDGISYDVYKSTWEVSGRIILDAWNHSVKIGQTSTTQREAVITLLEKKGKDKCDLSNLRPISLSNCDIKICTKTIALRTNKILEKLLSNTQTGYVPGRQVTNNNRLIEELIDMVNKSDDEAYLITLDAQKAFDSVDHDYMISALKAYKFPTSYIRWVEVIYKNLEASVLVNGYTTEKFKIEQSVKQGDALSCALFVLAIEPLLHKIQNNKEIIPVKIPCTGGQTGEIKKSGYADDITCFTASKLSLQIIINEYESFSDKSGIKLNIGKTEVLVMGKNDGNRETFSLIHKGRVVDIIDQDSVKICGITFSNDKSVAYRKEYY